MPIKYREETWWLCSECGWSGPEELFLRAPSPFDKSQEILGCPQCKEISPFEGACAAVGCTNPVTGGHPLPEGYRWTCWEHSPDNPKNQKEDEGGKG
jgi:hypothetical protein